MKMLEMFELLDRPELDRPDRSGLVQGVSNKGKRSNISKRVAIERAKR